MVPPRISEKKIEQIARPRVELTVSKSEKWLANCKVKLG
jgi:hypothetical protein